MLQPVVASVEGLLLHQSALSLYGAEINKLHAGLELRGVWSVLKSPFLT